MKLSYMEAIEFLEDLKSEFIDVNRPQDAENARQIAAFLRGLVVDLPEDEREKGIQ